MVMSKLRGLLGSNLLLGVMALATGAAAAWLGDRHLAQRANTLEVEARQRYAASPYIVASRDLSRGQRIDASLLSVRSMPKAYVPADALAPADASLLIGGRAAVGIRRGTPVVRSTLLPESAARLSEQLPDGMRAMTIQVDQLNALSGLLEAGDTVDLYYSRTRGTGAVLVPLMQRVRVLATGDVTESRRDFQSADQSMGDFSSVTLLVSPADAQRVVLAEQTGRLTLLLRRPADEMLQEARQFDSSELLHPSRRNAPRAPGHSLAVELLVGGRGSTPERSWLPLGEGA